MKAIYYYICMAVVLLIVFTALQKRIERLEQRQSIMIKEISNLQHDSIMLKRENLILYLKAERMQNWYDSIFNQGSEDNERKIYKGGGGGVDHQRVVRRGIGF
jgi:hypothetical protein